MKQAESKVAKFRRDAVKDQKRAEEWEARAERENELKKAAHREKRDAKKAAARLSAQVQRLKGEGGSSHEGAA